MCDFNNLSDTEKQSYHEQLMVFVQAFGGTNFFLQLLEAIRTAKPHPIIAKHKKFTSDLGTISWSKVIFQDKMDLLLKERIQETKRGNFLPEKASKNYKKVLNLVRTLGPIEFEITPNEGESITLHAFDIIDDDTTKINPMFDAIFFCAVDTVKKVLNYKA